MHVRAYRIKKISGGGPPDPRFSAVTHIPITKDKQNFPKPESGGVASPTCTGGVRRHSPAVCGGLWLLDKPYGRYGSCCDRRSAIGRETSGVKRAFRAQLLKLRPLWLPRARRSSLAAGSAPRIFSDNGSKTLWVGLIESTRRCPFLTLR